MIPLLSRIFAIALAGSMFVVWPFATGCGHSAHSSALRGGAPAMLNEDGPHREGTNPNAPYLMAASATPQLAHRSDTYTSGVNPCDGKSLTVTEIAASVNGKFRAVKLAFDNDGLTPCRIGGYPTITLLDQTGTPVANLVVDRVTLSTMSAQLTPGPVPAVTAPKPDAQIVIAPRGEAWFEVGWSTGEGCPVVSRISVSAPGSSENLTVNHPLTVCEGRVQITTLHSDQDSD